MKKVIKFILDIPGPSVYLTINAILLVLMFAFIVVPFIAVDWYKEESDVGIVEYYKKKFPIEKQIWFS